ncbi:myosin heavy chain kinase B [Spatholobus suberectus]|nr:myosin heavy chain kinase B [Spatholobus suberectus]
MSTTRVPQLNFSSPTSTAFPATRVHRNPFSPLVTQHIGHSKCLELINAQDNAMNLVVVMLSGCVLTGFADGTVKVWRKEIKEKGKKPKHVLDWVLLKQENVVWSLAVNRLAIVVYCGSFDELVNFWEHDQKGGSPTSVF